MKCYRGCEINTKEGENCSCEWRQKRKETFSFFSKMVNFLVCVEMEDVIVNSVTKQFV